MKYRIYWKNERTGKTGGGTATFSEEQAQAIADKHNEQDKDTQLIHWIEPVEQSEPEPDEITSQGKDNESQPKTR